MSPLEPFLYYFVFPLLAVLTAVILLFGRRDRSATEFHRRSLSVPVNRKVGKVLLGILVIILLVLMLDHWRTGRQVAALREVLVINEVNSMNREELFDFVE